ncbi:hypothetical protein LRP88_02044 [Fusarium phalaenopsidis]
MSAVVDSVAPGVKCGLLAMEVVRQITRGHVGQDHDALNGMLRTEVPEVNRGPIREMHDLGAGAAEVPAAA